MGYEQALLKQALDLAPGCGLGDWSNRLSYCPFDGDDYMVVAAIV